MHGGDSRLQYRQRNLDDADLVRHLPGRTLRSRRRGRLRLRHHALGRAADRSSRSRASFGGLASAVGAGLCVFLIPIFVAEGWSWRWMFVLSAAGVAMLPAMARLLPESERWELSDASGITTRTRFYDVFQPLYRKRSITMIVCALAAAISTTGANAFGYYHAVSVVGQSAAGTSAMTIVAGGLGLLGFPLGAWSAERFGRVPTVVVFGIAITAGHLWYFWGPPSHFGWPLMWLSAGFFWFNDATTAAPSPATPQQPNYSRLRCAAQ